MGGWKDDPSPSPSSSRRAPDVDRAKPFAPSRRDGAAGGDWRDAMRDVKRAASASGASARDELRRATRAFFDAASGRAHPPLGDAKPSEIAADVVLLARAINASDASSPSPSSSP